MTLTPGPELCLSVETTIHTDTSPSFPPINPPPTSEKNHKGSRRGEISVVREIMTYQVCSYFTGFPATDKQAGRQADRQADRQSSRQTHKKGVTCLSGSGVFLFTGGRLGPDVWLMKCCALRRVMTAFNSSPWHRHTDHLRKPQRQPDKSGRPHSLNNPDKGALLGEGLGLRWVK